MDHACCFHPFSLEASATCVWTTQPAQMLLREPSEVCGASDDDMNNSPGTRHRERSLTLDSKDRDQLMVMLIKDNCLRCSDMFFTFNYYSKLISDLEPSFPGSWVKTLFYSYFFCLKHFFWSIFVFYFVQICVLILILLRKLNIYWYVRHRACV